MENNSKIIEDEEKNRKRDGENVRSALENMLIIKIA